MPLAPPVMTATLPCRSIRPAWQSSDHDGRAGRAATHGPDTQVSASPLQDDRAVACYEGGVTEQTVAVGIALQSVQDPGAEARRFEELGYDYVTAGEHVAFNVPAANSFISLAVAAGATSRIRLLNSIALVPLYPAALLRPGLRARRWTWHRAAASA